MERHYITVLDFTDGKVYQYEVGASILSSEDYEAWLDQKGHKLSNIEWMLHKGSEIITN